MTNQARIDSLLQMLNQEPDDVFLNYALGLEYAKNSLTHSLAESQFKKVLVNNGQYIAAYYQLGQLYEQMGKKEEALEYYYKGLEIAKMQKNNKAINEINEAIFLLED
jgi:tetratricopeptide (TPR) repeat protein